MSRTYRKSVQTQYGKRWFRRPTYLRTLKLEQYAKDVIKELGYKVKNRLSSRANRTNAPDNRNDTRLSSSYELYGY